MDILEFDYWNTLTGRYEKRNILTRTLFLLWALPDGLGRILRAIATRNKSKGRSEKLQFLYAVCMLFLLVVYVGILFSAVFATIKTEGLSSGKLGTVAESLKNTTQEKSQPTGALKDGNQTGANATKKSATPPGDQAGGSGRSAGFAGFWLWASQAVVVAGALISIFLPSRLNLKEEIGKLAVQYLCVMYYLGLGERRNAIIGRLEALVDELLRRSEEERKKPAGNPYRHVHLMAFSFGSVIALDALFPPGRKPERPFGAIHTLITIGCPFDFVRMLWGSYFDVRREYIEDQPKCWLNVFSPVDALASNFRNDQEVGEANINIRAEAATTGSDVPVPANVPFSEGFDLSQLSWWSTLSLVGLRAHSMYWGPPSDTDVSCFNQLVSEMYADDEVLK